MAHGHEADPETSDLLEAAVEAARAGGRHALDHYARRAEVHRRFAHDVKLVLDLEAQQAAEAVLRRRFGAPLVVGEETADTNRPSDNLQWVIDPIDGTVNFTHGLPNWCCSVAARRGGRTLAGAVYAPMMDELYTAAADGPARRNGEILRVSATERLEEAIVTAGFVKRADDRSVSMNMIEALCPRVQKLRVMGAAALDLCNVAGGRVDGYVESRIFLWDVAAGSLIVERAGGRWEVVQPLDTFSMRFVASNGRLHDDLRAIVAGAWGG